MFTRVQHIVNFFFLSLVVAGQGAMCRPGEPLRLTATSGNIANVLTEETKLGSADCPWMIQVSLTHDFV